MEYVNPTLPGIDLSLEALQADAVALLRENVPADGQPYWGCYSGGKDSDVIKHIVAVAGVPCEWHYNVTTIDPPEIVHHVRRDNPDVSFDRPAENFFTMAKRKGFPIRRIRWCCEQYKEKRTPKGRVTVMGIRAAESPRRRATWQEITHNTNTNAPTILPMASIYLTHHG